ncbi:MAG: PDZ domain-containing protein [Candidatus Cloacimonetes bacterium]|nr:PDZ domain-containing protein [Candidatus Cloacimonadota bacterium]
MKLKTISIITGLFLLLISTALQAQTAYMGVTLENPTDEEYRELKFKGNYGVKVINVVNDSPADKAGISENDLILEIDGEKIYIVDQLSKMLTTFSPGQTLKVKLFNKGKEQNTKMLLGDKSDYIKVPMKTFLGVVTRIPEESEFKESKLETRYGLLISRVIKDSPADKAELKGGDLLLEMNGEKLYTPDQLSIMLQNHHRNDKISITYFRSGSVTTTNAVLTEKEKNSYFDFSGFPANIFTINQRDIASKKRLGISVSTDSLSDSQKKGLEIIGVEQDSPAAKAGIQIGDVLLEADGKKIKNIQDIRDILDNKETGNKMELRIERDGKIIQLETVIEESTASTNNEFPTSISFRNGSFNIQLPDNMIDLDFNSLKKLEVLKDLNFEEKLEETKEKLKELKIVINEDSESM